MKSRHFTARYLLFLLFVACFVVFVSAPSIGTAADEKSSQPTKIIKDKLDHIILPGLKFHEATVAEAIAFLRKKSVELDTTETDPARKGVNFVLKLEGTPASGTHAVSTADTRITLSLTNIPMSAALDYITKLAGLKYKIEPYAVTISHPSELLITKVYKVPPGFLGKSEALDYLKYSGVVFPPGASANFLSSSSKLVVRDTEENLDLVDQIVDNANLASASNQRINFQTRVFVVSESEWKKLPKLSHDLLTSFFADKPSHPAPTGEDPVTPQVSATTEPNIPKSEADILKQLVKGPDGVMQLNTRAAIAGVLTEGQRQAMARDLAKVGSGTASAPAFTIKSGKQQKIDYTKEFAYPAGYLPDKKSSATQPSPPPIGETVNVMGVVGPDGETIDLDFGVVNATGLLGFLTERNGRTTLLPAPIKAVRGVNYDKPVFTNATFGGEFPHHSIDASAKLFSAVSIWDGQTVLIAAPALAMQAGPDAGKPVVARKAVLIMISAHLINGGNFVEEEDEKEEDVAPLTTSPPAPQLPPIPTPQAH